MLNRFLKDLRILKLMIFGEVGSSQSAAARHLVTGKDCWCGEFRKIEIQLPITTDRGIINRSQI